MTETIWVAVADSGRARIFRLDERAGALVPALDRETETRLKPSRELALGSADCLSRLAAFLAAAERAGSFQRLILVAPPQALARLRGMLGLSVLERTVRAIAKDVTRLAPVEIREQLFARDRPALTQGLTAGFANP